MFFHQFQSIDWIVCTKFCGLRSLWGLSVGFSITFFCKWLSAMVLKLKDYFVFDWTLNKEITIRMKRLCSPTKFPKLETSGPSNFSTGVESCSFRFNGLKLSSKLCILTGGGFYFLNIFSSLKYKWKLLLIFSIGFLFSVHIPAYKMFALKLHKWPIF